MRKRIAIIGTGIAGMGCAHFLKDDYEIVFYEKENYAGGHTHTLTIDEEGTPVYIDSAFMVYNEVTYPNLTQLFKDLKVVTKDTDMSFSVQHKPSGLEYCGTGMNGLFAQRRRILSFRHWRMLLDMDRFNKNADSVLSGERYASMTVEEYVADAGLGSDFLNMFLLPMSSAVWSTSADDMKHFPIMTLVRFFKNHGFLGLDTHYTWRTVEGGSRMYRDVIMRSFKERVRLSSEVKSVSADGDQVTVTDQSGHSDIFDYVIMAVHADEAADIVRESDPQAYDILKYFRYEENRATLHMDERVMPSAEKAWSSWNYRMEEKDGHLQASTIYWMNNLQQVSKKRNYFISINDTSTVRPECVLWEKIYKHPVYDVGTVRAQTMLSDLNKNTGRIFYSGSYFRYGFHEDALTAAIEVVRALTGSIPDHYRGWR